MPVPGTTQPRFSAGSDESPFLKSDPEIRAAEKVLEKPHWLVGKRTYIGLALTVIGMIGHRYNLKLPVEEVNGFLDTLLANWDAIAEVVGAAIALYGNFKKAVSHKKTKAVVEVVANKLVDTTHEMDQLKTAVATAPIADAAKAKILNPWPVVVSDQSKT